MAMEADSIILKRKSNHFEGSCQAIQRFRPGNANAFQLRVSRVELLNSRSEFVHSDFADFLDI